MEGAIAVGLEFEASLQVIDLTPPPEGLAGQHHTRLFSSGVGDPLDGLLHLAVLVLGRASNLVVVMGKAAIIGEVLLILGPVLLVGLGESHLVLEGLEIRILAVQLRLQLIDLALGLTARLLLLFLYGFGYGCCESLHRGVSATRPYSSPK